MRILALLLVLGGAYGMLRGDDLSGRAEPSCPGPGCLEPGAEVAAQSAAGTAPLEAGAFCIDVGYLCAGLETETSIQLRRWTGFEGTMVVHVPLPDVGDATRARALQRAAAQGIRVWHERPFPILADLRGDRDPDFTVRWTNSLGARRLGVARTRWSAATGLGVDVIELAAMDPVRAGRLTEPRQVRLTAAHEMGHALGLGHSDARRDVMYPTNTATAMSAQDYRSIEVLYETADGTTVKR